MAICQEMMKLDNNDDNNSEISTEDQIKARERLDALVARHNIPRELVEDVETVAGLLYRDAAPVIERIRKRSEDYGISGEVLYDLYRDTLTKMGIPRSTAYYKLKAMAVLPDVRQRPHKNIPEQSLTNVEPEVENITMVPNTNVIEEKNNDNVMDDSQDARSESRIQAEVAASMAAAPADDDKKPIWHSMDKVQLIELVEATRDDNERNSGRCEELEDRNRELFEETRRLKKALFVQEGKKVEEVPSSPSSLPAGFVAVRQTELQDMQREIKALSEALKAAEIERDDFKEAATKSSFHSAVPKAGAITFSPYDFIDVFHSASIKRQKVKLEHDGLIATRATRITGLERGGGLSR